MKRITTAPRENYISKLEELSFKFHSLDTIYWDESAYYEFTLDEVNHLEKATNILNDMMLKAVQHVIDQKLYSRLFINPNLIELIERSWNEEEPSVYGRFDLGFDGLSIRLLEFNADTPTSLYEAAVIQWYWLQEVAKDKDQFNSIHEKLIDYWQGCRDYFNNETVLFSCIKDSIEDFTTVQYLRDTAHQAGLKTDFIYIPDIGWNESKTLFTDLDENPITNIFKLYPWEWLSNEEFGNCLNRDVNKCKWIEPAWKTILSNKGILPVLFELFPDSPYLLPCYADGPKYMTSYVKKPIYSREGANISIIRNGIEEAATTGEYGEEGFVYQELFEIPGFKNNYPIIGSWVINQQSAGMGIRESDTLITGNLSRFIPHLIK